MSNAATYEKQLPKWQSFSIQRLIELAGAFAGIAALFVTFFKLDDFRGDTKAIIFVGELTVLILLLASYIYYYTRRKLHRYAQAVFYIHYINHIIRDHAGKLKTGKTPDLQSVLLDAVDATANCFSLLVGRQCRCTIKELKEDGVVSTVVRDRMSKSQHADQPGTTQHTLQHNSDFNSIWSGSNGCSRYFFCNDLISLWKNREYENSSMVGDKKPVIKTRLGLQLVDWKLPYRSSIVLPIRYFPDNASWPQFSDTALQAGSSARPFLWGFLCIDCNSRGVFDRVHSPELGASIADAIFSLLELSQNQIDNKPGKEAAQDAGLGGSAPNRQL